MTADLSKYIKDFATLVPDLIDKEFQDCEGYPGVRSPQIWDYIAQYQNEAVRFLFRISQRYG